VNNNTNNTNPSQPEETYQPSLDISEVPRLPEGTPVVPDPVSSLELADSLFMTRNYAESLRTYHSVLEAEPSTEDRHWILLMLANCHRHQDQLVKAEPILRKVVNQRATDQFTAEHGRWSLKMIERRKLAREQLQQLESSLKELTSTEDQQ
jgi:hypothetical protein